jgi:hypothetical protein
MLRRSQIAAVERNVAITDGFTTEPYETGWAIEGRWFVHILEAEPEALLAIHAQVSPDGLTWCDHEAAPVWRNGTGLLSLPLTQLGPWQRLACRVDHTGSVRAICYLTLKG